MKGLLLMVLFVTILVSGVYGQTRPENRWIVGTWAGACSDGDNFEIVLNDNGTGRWNLESIIFSITGNGLRIIRATGHQTIENVNIERINDNRMVLIDGIWYLNLSRRN